MCAQEKVLRQWLEDVHRDLLWTGGGGEEGGDGEGYSPEGLWGKPNISG